MEIRPTTAVGSAAFSGIERPTSASPAHAASTVAPRQAESAVTADAVKPAQPAPKAEEVDNAVKTLNQAIKAHNHQIEFTVDADTSRTVVAVVDTATKEVIRQMPSQEALELAKAMDKLQSLLAKQTA